MKIQIRPIWVSHMLGIGVFSHNRWGQIGRGFTVYLLVVAIVFTRRPHA